MKSGEQDTGDHETGHGHASERACETPDTLEERVSALEATLQHRTVDRETLEGTLRQYVRRRQRRGHARGWGPYLVLLYGTASTVCAFYFLSGGWAILAMVVVWLSTLGLYVLFVLAGIGLSLLARLGSLPGWLGRRRRR